MLTRTKIRQAKKSDAPFIVDLFNANEALIRGLDWEDIGDTWWVAVHRGEIIGAVQVLVGKPLGVITFLVVDPRFHNSGVGIQLASMANIILGVAGADGVMFSTNNDKVKRRTGDMGYMDLCDTTVYVKRIYRYEKS